MPLCNDDALLTGEFNIMSEYKGKKALIIGMAKSGIAAACLLSQLGSEVTIYDAKTKEEFPEGYFDRLENIAYRDMLGKDPMSILEDIDLLVLSPGVPMTLLVIKKAYEMNKVVMAEIELGFSVSKADFIAITGTNGKTTTTALTGEIFKNAGYNTYVLGNIGIPVAQEALHTKKGDVVVAETAALQMDSIISYKPKGSAILNITEDHLDRYGTMEQYIAAKARIFKNQDQEDYCVLNYDNEIVRSLEKDIRAKIVWFSVDHELENGAFLKDGVIVYKKDGQIEPILDADLLQIPGRHNLENALAATALACEYGIKGEVVGQTLATFTGVEHRLEFVRKFHDVVFINDSKGTNPDATINAVRAMKAPTVLILGGYDKHSDFIPLFEAFSSQIKAVVILGQTAMQIALAAKEAGYENYIMANGFEDAVLKAYSLAEPGDTVLLSPACASWDMFENFEKRGEKFKEIVRGL